MIGETIGNFKIVSRLGRGGMGEVWLAEQQSIGTKVAIKLLNANISEDTEHVQRFFNEARAVSRIQHAGIVKIFDVGHHAGHAYLIMEYLEGETLAKRIAATRRLSVADLSEIGRQVASVLDATHSAGITHRDLKPDNIYVVADRELPRGYRVKILDFGIAKLTGTLAVVSPRTTGTMGTPTYMAPEQWGDASKVDWRADLYSLGCVAFEMATGRPPFIVTNIAEACAKHLSDPPPHVRELFPDLPLALDQLVDRLLAKSPDARAASMRDVERAFASLPTSQPMALAETVGPTSPRKTMTSDGRISATVLETAKTRSRGPRIFLSVAALALAGFASLVVIKKMQRRDIHMVSPPEHAHETVAAVADAAMPATTPPLADAGPAVVAAAPVDAAHAATHPGAHADPKHTASGRPVKDRELDPSKEGKIDADAVFKLAANDTALRQCYLIEVAKDMTLAGSVTAMVTVDPKGSVIKSSATGVNPAVSGCVAHRLSQLTFPPVTGGDYAIVYMPFKFVPPDPSTMHNAGQLTATAEPGDAPPVRLANTLTQSDVAAGLMLIQGRLDPCDATGKGRGTMELWIDADGRVTNAKVLGTLAGTDIATCIENVLKTKGAFAKSRSGLHATVRFHLSKP